jgi:hypothetical protein
MAMAEPAQALLSASVAVVPGWVARCVARVLVTQDREPSDDVRRATEQAGRFAQDAVTRDLAALLAQDVDEQRSNPLAVLRGVVRYPTAVLRAAGAAPVRRDEYQTRAFPDDVYDLSPANWSDVDPSLHEPGIAWGAWKAKTVLDRRRAEGRR